MPLEYRRSEKDTLGEMERAAMERFWDAAALGSAPARRTTGTIYVMGYVAEILVKCAYYRVRGLLPHDTTEMELRGARGRATNRGLPWTGNLHNLPSWAGLLVAERQDLGRELPAVMHVSFLSAVNGIAAEWSETLRYKDIRATETEVRRVYRCVEWLVANYASLWS